MIHKLYYIYSVKRTNTIIRKLHYITIVSQGQTQ